MLWKLAIASATTLVGSAIATTVYSEGNDGRKVEAKHDQLLFVPRASSYMEIQDAVKKAEQLCLRLKEESGTPGLTISVTVDGKPVLNKGFGLADVENHVNCNSNTVMRIASISKALTMTVVARLWQENQLSFDVPIHEYVPTFPKKSFDGEEVQITLRHLVSHLSGIRHYEKVKNWASIKSELENNLKDASSVKKKDEFENKEYMLKDYYESVNKALCMFKDDELHHRPGTKFLYTTHGWTLVSAAVEGVVKRPFQQFIKTFFHEMGLRNTYLDENNTIIYNRARQYVRNAKGRLENAPMVDNSYKWAGGGFLSTSEDLAKFGTAMLYSFQNDDGYLNRQTVGMIWSPVENTKLAWDKDGKYGMGWGVVPSNINHPFCNVREFYVSHTGGAVGGSSVLLIYPRSADAVKNETPVRGVVVAMIANLQSAGLNKTALEIAQMFDQADS